MKNIWWNQVTNAVNFVSQIVDTLLEEKSILLKHALCMPWSNEFKQTVIDSIKMQNAEKRFSEITGVNDPGLYLLNEFCKKEKRAAYRPAKGYAKFLAESNDIVLHDRYLWVKVENSESLQKWMTFASDYLKERGNKNKAVFIFDMLGETNAVSKRGIRQYSFDDYIGEYDRIVFTVLASSGIRRNSFMKKYLAELVSNVTGNDIELCAACIAKHKEFMDNPYETIRDICNNDTRSDGTPFVFTKTKNETDHAIWLSQIKTIYPFIEEYREDFVQKYSNQIQKQLPISAPYGEAYKDPKDVELGTLKYMADNGLIKMTTMEHEKLSCFKEARNKLSHLSYLSMDEIRTII